MADLITKINTGIDDFVGGLFGTKAAAPASALPPFMQGIGTAKPQPTSIVGNGQVGPLAAPAAAPKVSTTTLSNGNKIDAVAANKASLAKLSEKGNKIDPNGNTVTANGDVVPPPPEKPIAPPASTKPEAPKPTYTDSSGVQRNQDGTPAPIPDGATYDGKGGYTGADGKKYKAPAGDTSYEDQQITTMLDTMKSTTDASTASAIESIKRQFEMRKQQQEEANKSGKGMVVNALLMGGATGKGSSSQYAPISSAGIIQSQEAYGVRQLAQLDAMEDTAISEATAAGDAQNFKIMEAKIGQINTIRKEKADQAAKLQNLVIENNQKEIDRKKQADRDMAIADIYTSGATDAAAIMKKAKEAGLVVTSDEVAGFLKNAIPSGLDDLVKTLRTNGAPEDVIRKVLGATNMSEAYKLAGGFAAGGTGMIGEYNFYKAQAIAAGQTPVDFNTYQDMDANRKRSIAAASVDNASGLNPKQVTIFNSLVDKQNKSPLIAANDRAVILKTITEKLKADPTNASLQVSFIYSMIQALDTYQSSVREGEIGLLSSTQGVLEKIKNLPSRIENGNPLSDKKIKEYMDTATMLTDAIGSAAAAKKKAFEAQANVAGVGDAFSSYNASVYGDTGSNVVQSEDAAKKGIIDYGTKNPAQQASIKRMVADGKSYLEIKQILNI